MFIYPVTTPIVECAKAPIGYFLNWRHAWISAVGGLYILRQLLILRSGGGGLKGHRFWNVRPTKPPYEF